MRRMGVGRRWILGGLAAGLIAAGGCSSTRPALTPGMGGNPEPMHDIDTTPRVGTLDRVRGWFAGHKGAQIDPGQFQ